jgi:catechol 2,3-dioxygenase-like lactoylglutathione lyase family enzyme
MRFDHVALQVPDIDAAVTWYRETLENVIVHYQDDSWALIEAGGAKLAFVVAGQHPTHVAWRVSMAELGELAAKHRQEIHVHRDHTESFYLAGPGGHCVEIIGYPESP